MPFLDLHAEVEAMFAELQSAPTLPADLRQTGLRVINNNRAPRNSLYERSVARSKDKKTADREVRLRILAGERPKRKPKCVGRPPTRWIRIADELGIDLTAP